MQLTKSWASSLQSPSLCFKALTAAVLMASNAPSVFDTVVHTKLSFPNLNLGNSAIMEDASKPYLGPP